MAGAGQRLGQCSGPHAKNLLAHMYYCGEVPFEAQSYETAYRLHREASTENGDSATQRAFQERVGCGCRYDFKRNVAYYEEIIASGDDLARLELAKLYTGFGQFSKAFDQYNAMTELSPEAAYNLGMLYKRGVHTDPPMPDHLHAAYYLSLAADVHPQAALELGLIYFMPSGNVIRKDFPRAERYFTFAAQHGNAVAQYMLGFMFEHGYVTRNIEKAISCFEKAVALGHALSAAELATVYQLDGPTRDFSKAYANAEFAATHGVADGAFILGCLQFMGRGCKADLEKARQNLEYAKAHGIYPATVMLEKLDKSVSRDENA